VGDGCTSLPVLVVVAAIHFHHGFSKVHGAYLSLYDPRPTIKPAAKETGCFIIVHSQLENQVVNETVSDRRGDG
jgi:hypothetical protein